MYTKKNILYVNFIFILNDLLYLNISKTGFFSTENETEEIEDEEEANDYGQAEESDEEDETK